LFTSLIENLPVIIKMIVEKLPLIIEGIVRSIESLFYRITDAGKNLVIGLWDGIKSMAKWLWDKVGDFFGGIVDGILDFLGIHSPSTLFAGIGENMGEGVGVGFIDSMKSVEDEIKDAIPTDFDIEAKTNIRSIATDMIQPVNSSDKSFKNGLHSNSITDFTSEGSMEQVNLLREQNRLLKQLLEKEVNISIGDEEIGRANTRYEKKRGLVVNEGGFSNAY
jgi:phage-related protein